MYVVWRKRPVKGSGGAPFLLIDPDYDCKFTCWMPLKCSHAGSSRVAHTPLVVASERKAGQPRQKLLARFPTIRSCCITDPFARAAWWHRVDLEIRNWSDFLSSDPLYLDFSRDGPDILRKLREVVPKPNARGLAEFTAYRLAKEAEYKLQQEEEREWQRQENERWDRERQRQQEEARRATEGQWGGQNRRFWEEFVAEFAGQGNDQCFAVLGLAVGCTLDQVKRRHRELAMKHHPDRGGDPKEFAKYQSAYERACEILARRTSA